MRRLAALATVVTAVALAAPAAEAKPFTYKDAKGDMPANAGLDITAVTYSTTGNTTVRKVRGRTVKKYEPTKLVATMTLAGAPVDQPGVKYKLTSQLEACGDLTFTYAKGAGEAALSLSQGLVGCGGPPGTTGGDTLFFDPQFAIKGSKLVWTVPLKVLPKDKRAGALLYSFRATVDAAEPIMGLIGPQDAGVPVFDSARSDDDWAIS